MGNHFMEPVSARRYFDANWPLLPTEVKHMVCGSVAYPHFMQTNLSYALGFLDCLFLQKKVTMREKTFFAFLGDAISCDNSLARNFVAGTQDYLNFKEHVKRSGHEFGRRT